MSHVAVILSGCGYLDGAEVRESVLTLLYLDQQGAEVSVYAPNIEQYDTVDHLNQMPKDIPRNVLAESARIARGDIKPLSDLSVDAIDALILPGGFGVAKNLSDFATKGTGASVLPELQNVIEGCHAANKPIGAICIAPALLAVALKGRGLTLTIGEDADTASAIEALGHHHRVCPSAKAVVDEVNHIASCSAYMREDSLASIARGIEAVVSAVLAMAHTQHTTKVG